jgi:glycosyltransferase involved in cell wall biosynthesis
MTDPKVTVLMAVYNGERYLRQSIESILSQTFTDFEFLIIDDGSTDSTPEILEEYNERDERIRIIHQENIGLTKSLNRGLGLSRGYYIARTDADDVSLRERLEHQVSFLDNHPEIGVLGSGAVTIDREGNVIHRFFPTTGPSVVRWRLIFGNCISHPTVLFRKNLVLEAGGYPCDSPVAQDYDLWSRLAFITEIDNLPEILVKYRLNPRGISSVDQYRQVETSIRVVRNNIAEIFGLDVTEDVAKALCDSQNVRETPLKNGELLTESYNLITRFRDIYFKNYNFSPEEMSEINNDILNKILALLRANAGYFPYKSLQTLFRALVSRPAVVFRSPFWITIIKAVLRSKRS